MIKISDVDVRLDFMITLAIRPRAQWFKIAESLKDEFPARLFEESEKKVLQIYLPKHSISQKDASIIKSMPKGVEKNEYYTQAFVVQDTHAYNVLYALLDIRSMIIAQTFVLRGELYFSFRFHNSVMRQVNVALGKILENGRFRLIYLGMSPGILSLIDNANRNTPLSVIRIMMPITGFTNLPEGIGSIEFLAEGEIRRIDAAGTKVIIYTDKEIPSLTSISKEDKIYESIISEPFNLKLAEMAHQARIPLMGLFGTFKDGNIEITMLLPTSETDEYLQLFQALKSSMNMEDVILVMCAPVNKGVLETM